LPSDEIRPLGLLGATVGGVPELVAFYCDFVVGEVQIHAVRAYPELGEAPIRQTADNPLDVLLFCIGHVRLRFQLEKRTGVPLVVGADPAVAQEKLHQGRYLAAFDTRGEGAFSPQGL
jgi:hypothetical protein